MRALLDINVLLALLDASHVDHRRAREWISGEIGHGWASCALTENGFVRIISQPKYPSPVSPSEAIDRLRRATSTEYHEFWPCSVSLLEGRHVDPSHLHGPRQVTDVYLLALAVQHGGRLVSFDQTIPLSAAPGAGPEHLVVL
ncbi:MAG TPA: type II toxin-antitoxin system VapC family toxin [Thermoanaerobaculia bacterium]|nr:type II toxin-antitoxin system VapC family toxin [Thermoanaerobaculia bacterium]